MSEPTPRDGLSRREMIVAGSLGLLGAGLFTSCKTGNPKEMPGRIEIGDARVRALDGGDKRVYLAQEGALDPVSHTIADTLFWTDILAEHALFFQLLMPGDDLADEREEAEDFQEDFQDRFEDALSASLDKEDVKDFNQDTIELVKPFIDWKRKMRDLQASGKLQSLVWPLFFDHTAREADRFLRRLQQYSSGQTEYDRAEVVSFWSQIMAEHADFIAHLLDPMERELVCTAMEKSGKLRGLKEDEAEKAAQDIIDFKVAAAKGIKTGQIKSILKPELADHVRREAVRFADELKRSHKA